MAAPVASALSGVAAQASIAYELLLSPMETVKSFHEGMRLVNSISKVPRQMPPAAEAVADQEYKAAMGEAVIRPLQPTRFGRGQACYSLRQIFVPCHFANAFAITIAMLSSEFKLNEAPRINLSKTEQDWATIVHGPESDSEMDEQNLLQPAGNGQLGQPDVRDRADQEPEAEGGEGEVEDNSLLDLKQFANALRIPGMLHVSDNCLGHILQSCKCWPALLQGLRMVEVLLCRPLYRERFLYICVGEKRAAEDNLNKWSHSLKGLRQSWDKDLFMNKTGGAILANEKDALHSESIQESFGVTVEKLDQVLKDPCHAASAFQFSFSFSFSFNNNNKNKNKNKNKNNNTNTNTNTKTTTNNNTNTTTTTTNNNNNGKDKDKDKDKELSYFTSIQNARTLARAPAASLSYLSLDLRFAQLVHTAIVEPRLFQHAIENLYKSLSSLSGFRTAVVAILGLRQANLHICNLKERQLADLLYRDDLSLKHSTAGQIRMAVDNLLQKNAAAADSGESGKRKAEALSAALVEFLIEALGLGTWAPPT
eukprot:s1520_g1.t1